MTYTEDARVNNQCSIEWFGKSNYRQVRAIGSEGRYNISI